MSEYLRQRLIHQDQVLSVRVSGNHIPGLRRRSRCDQNHPIVICQVLQQGQSLMRVSAGAVQQQGQRRRVDDAKTFLSSAARLD